MKITHTYLKLSLLAGIGLFSLSAGAHTVHYHHRPLRIHLKPRVERWVTFPGRVQVDARGSGLTQGMLRLLNNHGTLYFTAYQSFSQRRILVRLLKTGQTVLVDVKSDKQGQSTPITVVFNHTHSSVRTICKHHPHTPQHRTLNLVQLMRFAIGQLYGQDAAAHHTTSRLIKAIPLSSQDSIPCAVKKLFADKNVQLSLRAQWRTTQIPYLTITAIHVKNTSRHKITLHPEHLSGHFKAASLYPRITLHSDNKRRNDTTFFLMSDHPVVVVREGCV